MRAACAAGKLLHRLCGVPLVWWQCGSSRLWAQSREGGCQGHIRVASRHYMRQPLLPHNEGEGALISELHLVADGGVVVGVGSVQLCVHIHEEAV